MARNESSIQSTEYLHVDFGLDRTKVRQYPPSGISGRYKDTIVKNWDRVANCKETSMQWKGECSRMNNLVKSINGQKLSLRV
jgi:hypothetical protein